jgi:hypothetical protein
MTRLADFRLLTKGPARGLVFSFLLASVALSQFAHAQAPIVSSVVPNIGPTAGTRKVTINGTNFVNSNLAATFGGVAATSVTFVSSTKSTAVTPKHSAGEVTVGVSDSNGSGSLANAYTYTAGPVVFSISPDSGKPAGGNVVKLLGANLKTVTSVLFGTSAATIQSTGPSEVDVVAPSGAGSTNVTVQNPQGKYIVNNGYTYLLSISTQSLDDSNNKLPYSNTLKSIGGKPPLTWSVSAGKVPGGLKLNASTGTLSGTANSQINTYSATFKVTDSSQPPQTATKKLSMNNIYGFQAIPIPATYFGMSIYDQNNVYPLVPFGSLGKGDATVWPFLEQQQGVYNWKPLDEYVAVAQANGLPFYWTNANIPPWAAADTKTCSYYQGTHIEACTSMVKNIADLDTFINALVARYKGKITMYELWNEPNVPNVFTGTVAQMVELTQHVYNDVRNGDPNALIASPSSTDADWLLSYFQAGGPTGVDIIDLHGYPNVSQDDSPEAIVGFKTVNPKINLASIHLQTKPIWDSENSWGGPLANKDPDYRASFVARSLFEQWSVGMRVNYWYGWDEPIWGTLFIPPNDETLAGTTYGIVEGWMLGATMPYPCSENGGTYWLAVYTCDLTRTGGYQARAVFDTTQTCKNGVCTTSSYTPASEYIQYRDITGAVYPISPGETVQIGLKPILLENQNP